jgi:hypothetical protein
MVDNVEVEMVEEGQGEERRRMVCRVEEGKASFYSGSRV